MNRDSDGGILARAFQDAIVTTISQLSGSAPKVEPAPDLITDGVLGHIHIVGGWTGTITSHCSAGAISFLESQMEVLLIDRVKDKDLAVVEMLLETVGNAFMHKFTIKSAVSSPKAHAWSLAKQARIKELKEMWKFSCSLPSGVFSFSLAQGASPLSLEDL